jgi:hypothetical protein
VYVTCSTKLTNTSLSLSPRNRPFTTYSISNLPLSSSLLVCKVLGAHSAGNLSYTLYSNGGSPMCVSA